LLAAADAVAAALTTMAAASASLMNIFVSGLVGAIVARTVLLLLRCRRKCGRSLSHRRLAVRASVLCNERFTSRSGTLGCPTHPTAWSLRYHLMMVLVVGDPRCRV